MNEVLLNTGVVVFIIYAAVSIAYQVSNYRTGVAIRQFVSQSSDDMRAAMAELRATLENFRKISDDVTTVTRNVREITTSVADLQRNVRTMYGFIRGTAGARTRAELAGLNAGIRTGVATLVKGLKKERSDEHERRT
jgi:hypothetical protein